MTRKFTLGDIAPPTTDLARYVRLGRARVSVGWRRARLSLARSPRPLDPERAITDLPDTPRILVLCLGNICRSPMAERYLRAGARERGIDLSVHSAGFIETEDRPSPDDAVTAAAEYGVDLDDHRSTLVTEGMLARSDLVVLMDAENYTHLDRRFGRWTDRAYFLGAFTEEGSHEITDPYGSDVAEFRRVYDEIATATDALLAELAEGST